MCNGRSGSVLVPFRQFRGIPFLPFRSDEIGPVPRNCYPLAQTRSQSPRGRLSFLRVAPLSARPAWPQPSESRGARPRKSTEDLCRESGTVIYVQFWFANTVRVRVRSCSFVFVRGFGPRKCSVREQSLFVRVRSWFCHRGTCCATRVVLKNTGLICLPSGELGVPSGQGRSPWRTQLQGTLWQRPQRAGQGLLGGAPRTTLSR